MLDGVIGFVVGGLDLAGGIQWLVRSVVEQRIGKGRADECRLGSPSGETIAVAAAETFEETMGFQPAKVVSEFGMVCRLRD